METGSNKTKEKEEKKKEKPTGHCNFTMNCCLHNTSCQLVAVLSSMVKFKYLELSNQRSKIISTRKCKTKKTKIENKKTYLLPF